MISLDMTMLEKWTLFCIINVFETLLAFGIILAHDQMIIQVHHNEMFHGFSIFLSL